MINFWTLFFHIFPVLLLLIDLHIFDISPSLSFSIFTFPFCSFHSLLIFSIINIFFIFPPALLYPHLIYSFLYSSQFLSFPTLFSSLLFFFFSLLIFSYYLFFILFSFSFIILFFILFNFFFTFLSSSIVKFNVLTQETYVHLFLTKYVFSLSLLLSVYLFSLLSQIILVLHLFSIII